MARNKNDINLASEHLTIAYGPDETSVAEMNSHDRLRLLAIESCTGIGISKLGVKATS